MWQQNIDWYVLVCIGMYYMQNYTYINKSLSVAKNFQLNTDVRKAL